MSTVRPVIGICGGESPAKKRNDGKVVLNRTYVDAVEKGGGIPLVLPTTNSPEHALDMVRRTDGLLLPGGPDISPSRYGRRKHPSHKPLPQRHEELVFRVLAAAEEDPRGIPILGICLGAQVMNVHRGGTLVQDVPTQWPGAVEHRRLPDSKRTLHAVSVESDTLLSSIVGAGTLETNSSHHQAIEHPGRGLMVSARARDGVVEAVEDPACPFFLALQWHPETIILRKKHLALLQAFIRAASEVEPAVSGVRASAPPGSRDLSAP